MRRLFLFFICTLSLWGRFLAATTADNYDKLSPLSAHHGSHGKMAFKGHAGPDTAGASAWDEEDDEPDTGWDEPATLLFSAPVWYCLLRDSGYFDIPVPSASSAKPFLTLRTYLIIRNLRI